MINIGFNKQSPQLKILLKNLLEDNHGKGKKVWCMKEKNLYLSRTVYYNGSLF